jgi:rod shape-determining protein MreD
VQSIKQFMIIFSSFFLAWILMIMPLPYDWQWIRPEWLTLVLIYWVFALPQTVGVMTGWCVGLVMDILGGVLLGQHAMAMAVVAYFAYLLRNRLRLFPFWQQALCVLMLVGVGELVLLLVQWLIGQPPRTSLYWASTFSSVIFWPWISRLLRMYERKTALL